MGSRSPFVGPAAALLLGLGLVCATSLPAHAVDNHVNSPEEAFQTCVGLSGTVTQWVEDGETYTQCCLADDVCVVCHNFRCVGFGPPELDGRLQPGGGSGVRPGAVRTAPTFGIDLAPRS